MNSIVARTYCGENLQYLFVDGVIKHDYYKDHLVKALPTVIEEVLKKKQKIAVLDLATGNGYTAVIMAKMYAKHIDTIVACDINPKAVKLAKTNAQLNHCNLKKITFRTGMLYEPIGQEKFDLILSALPPVPIVETELRHLPAKTRAHHWPHSTAGKTGRVLLDKMIEGAPQHLYPGGIILTAQADFQNATKSTVSVMKKSGLSAHLVGEKKSIKLKTTTLTNLRRGAIEKLGYEFTKDGDGDEQFFVLIYQGTKDD